MEKTIKIEITPKTILTCILIIIGLIVFWQIRFVFFIFLIAFIINSTFRQLVDVLEEKKIPRIISTLFIFLIFWTVIITGVVSVASEASDQLNSLFNHLPDIIYNLAQNLVATFNLSPDVLDPELVKSNFKEVISGFLKFDYDFFATSLSSAFGVLNIAATITISMITTMILSIYMLVRKQEVYEGPLAFLKKDQRARYRVLFKKIQERLGRWLRTQLSVMFSAAFIVWLLLSLPALISPDYTLHNYALPIAFVVFLFEIVPGTGLFIGAILSLLISAGSGDLFALVYSLIFYVALGQIQSMIIMPKLMKKVMGIDPIVTILAIMAGYLLFDVLGIVLIIPLIVVLQIVIDFSTEVDLCKDGSVLDKRAILAEEDKENALTMEDN